MLACWLFVRPTRLRWWPRVEEHMCVETAPCWPIACMHFDRALVDSICGHVIEKSLVTTPCILRLLTTDRPPFPDEGPVHRCHQVHRRRRAR